MPDPSVALPPDCWHRIFANDHPVAIEIGPGRGEFLLASARREARWNFFAIEHSVTNARQIEARVAHAGLANARVIAGDARCLLEWLPAGSVAAFYVLFPDPWWKRRHHRRRLWTPSFVAAVGRALACGGTVELITDVADTFALAQARLNADPAFEVVTVGHPVDLQTSFARKAAQRGATIYRSVHRRIGG